ncbi:MAG: murein L,D-transpeptidase [Rhizobiales bacterium PAR1]|nr:MAG: murein L,D-transpeptidase [Rhizobiales bacterium PAR1]
MNMSENRVFRVPASKPRPIRSRLMMATVASLALMSAMPGFAQQAEPAPAATDVVPAPAAAEAPATPAAEKAEVAKVDAPAPVVDVLNIPEAPIAELYIGDIAVEKPAVAATEPAEKPVELAAPAPAVAAAPEVPKAAEAPDVVLQLPEPPAVVVTMEPPQAMPAVDPPKAAAAPPAEVKPVEAKVAEAGLKLDLDDAKLRTLLEPARVKYRLKPAEIDGFVAAYTAREFRPFWLVGPAEAVVLSSKADALAATLTNADRDGMDPVRLISALPQSRKGPVAAAMQADVDVQTSLAAFLYARDARGGRLEPSRLSALMTPKLDIPSPAEVLERLSGVEARGLAAVLEGYQPQHPGYQALRKALGKLREELAAPVLTGSVAGVEGAPHPTGTLPANWLEGEALAPNKADPRVPMLRLRLGMTVSASNLYDAELQNAVKAFQRANDLTGNGKITPKTRAALENPNAPITLADRKPDRQAQLNAMLTNMERWRWLPSDLGKFHVFVNVPDFQLKVVADNAIVHQTRVIVGRPDTQTPIFSDRMEHLIVNPSWGVPASILKKEFLPKMAADPDYAAKRGFQVVRNGNSISIRQPPGERNALGFIKFIFPNQHSVYLHDTPNRSLFSADFRAFSHGCVRVDKPFALAEKLLSVSTGLSEQQLRSMVGRGERMIKLQDKIPVHLTYFTVFVDENGQVQQRRDLYGHDARIKNALQL